jgi:hypothetical protein
VIFGLFADVRIGAVLGAPFRSSGHVFSEIEAIFKARPLSQLYQQAKADPTF